MILNPELMTNKEIYKQIGINLTKLDYFMSLFYTKDAKLKLRNEAEYLVSYVVTRTARKIYDEILAEEANIQHGIKIS